MRHIDKIVKIDKTGSASFVNSNGVIDTSIPELTIGEGATIYLDLRSDTLVSGALVPYDGSAFQSAAVHYVAIGQNYSPDSLSFFNSNASLITSSDGMAISASIPTILTENLVNAVGTRKSVPMLMELGGIDESGKFIYSIQFQISLLGRIYNGDEIIPTPPEVISPDYYTAIQVDNLFVRKTNFNEQVPVIALAAVNSAGYVLSSGVLPIVSAGGYATSAAVSSIVSSAVAGIDVPDDLADLTDTTDKIGIRAAAVVSSGGYTTTNHVSTIAASAGSAAVVSALAAVAGSGYATSAGVLEVVSSSGYATSATVSSIVATAADSAVTSTLSAVASSGYTTSAAVLPIVSAGGYTTSATVSSMIDTAIEGLPSGGTGDGLTSAQASSIALSAVNSAGYVLSGGVVPIVSAGGYTTSATVSSIAATSANAAKTAAVTSALTSVANSGYATSSAVSAIVSAGNFVSSAAVLPIVSAGGYTTSATVSGMISAAIDEIPPGGGGTDSAAVHIYSASIGADGMVTVSGGAVTVPSLAIGDEITSGGRLWRKARQEAVVYTTSTVVSSAGGTPNSDVIIVSGAGTEMVNGTYNIVDSSAVETARIWKHESAQLWISWDSLGVAGWYLGCSYSQEPGASDAYYIQATPTGGFIDPPDVVWSSGLFEGSGGASPMPTVAYGTNPAVNSNVLVVSGAGTTSVNGLYNIVDSSASGQARVWSNSENNLVVKFDSNEMFSWFIGTSETQAGYKGKYTAPNVNVADPVGLTWQTQTGFNNGAEDPPPTVEFLALPGTSSTVVTSSVESAHIAVFNEQTEINGESGAPTVAIIADPAVEFTVLNATYGRCVQLDATTPVMSFAAPVWGVSKIRLRVVTANQGITGNVVLVPVVDGEDGDAVTVAVGGTAAPVEVKFSTPVSGTLALRRNCEDSRDTLQDGEPVAVLVLNAEMVIRHE